MKNPLFRICGSSEWAFWNQRSDPRKFSIKSFIVGSDYSFRFRIYKDGNVVNNYGTLEDIANIADTVLLGDSYVVDIPVPDDLDLSELDTPNGYEGDFSRLRDVIKERLLYEIDTDYSLEYNDIKIECLEYEIKPYTI